MARSYDDRTPLHIAYLNGCDQMIDLLVKNGSDIMAIDEDGLVPSDCK